MIIGMLFTCIILLIACSGSGESSSKDNNGENSNGSLPEPIEIDEELREDGVDLTLESISFEENYIVVDFNAVNTTGHAVDLAAEGIPEDSDSSGLIFEDDTGHTYEYIADRSDHRIKLMDSEKVIGS